MVKMTAATSMRNTGSWGSNSVFNPVSTTTCEDRSVSGLARRIRVEYYLSILFSHYRLMVNIEVAQ